MVIFSGDLPESSFEKELSELRKALQESTGGISYEDNWGKRELAYKMKRQQRGYYVIFTFASAPAGITELRTNIKLNQNVLRHMLITIPLDYEPGRYKEEVFTEHKRREETKEQTDKKRMSRTHMRPEDVKAPRAAPAHPTVAGKKEEEELKTVEKKLEQILENPDIDVR